MTTFFNVAAYTTGVNQDLTVTLASTGLFIAKFPSDITKVSLIVFNET